MPRLVLRTDRDREIEELIAARERFDEGFGRSKKGNLWCKHDGMTLTIFATRFGGFKWSIAYGDGEVRYSPERFESEDDALGDLAEVVLAGE